MRPNDPGEGNASRGGGKPRLLPDAWVKVLREYYAVPHPDTRTSGTRDFWDDDRRENISAPHSDGGRDQLLRHAPPETTIQFSLDSSQESFCNKQSENVRLLAPAGCGKTLSLLLRCLRLAQRSRGQRVRFLIVTFTVAARQELASGTERERLTHPERLILTHLVL